MRSLLTGLFVSRKDPRTNSVFQREITGAKLGFEAFEQLAGLLLD